MGRAVDDYDERDKNLREIGFSSYRAYLFSKLWAKIRKRVLKRDKSKCLLCGQEACQVHHLDYSLATLRGDSVSMLASLCQNCHDDVEMDDYGKKRSFHDSTWKFWQLRKMFVANGASFYVDEKQRASDMKRLTEIKARQRQEIEFRENYFKRPSKKAARREASRRRSERR